MGSSIIDLSFKFFPKAGIGLDARRSKRHGKVWLDAVLLMERHGVDGLSRRFRKSAGVVIPTVEAPDAIAGLCVLHDGDL